ncbi:PAS domain-containing protein [Methylobacterium sp. WL9]|uniref:PAS domain-containing protein n=1 Tax=Methylobacterium sp. WL9 TaxID=2603898 RepID=UPI0011C6FEF6|nr:PAS domain-containing protein [Methylobacterium sp. WL9]TXN19266.1 PAS domain-containing protein [Methylobacterium sp. WL9]
MPVSPSLPDTELAAALDKSACLGAWTHDVSADRFSVAASLAHALDLAPEERTGVPLARVLSLIHAEDRPRIAGLLSASQEAGGPFEAEFRTWEGRRGARWLRLMGRTDIEGGHRAVRARGLAFDLTEGRLGRGSPARQAQWQANQLADHVIAMKGLVPPLGNPSLARLVDRLAVEIGFELARRLTQAAGDVRH